MEHTPSGEAEVSLSRDPPHFMNTQVHWRVQKKPPLVLILNHISSWRSVLILFSHLHLGLPMISFWYVLFQTHRKDYDKDKIFNVIDRNNNCWCWIPCVQHTYSVGKKQPSGAFVSLHCCENRYCPLYTCTIQLECRSTDLHEIWQKGMLRKNSTRFN